MCKKDHSLEVWPSGTIIVLNLLQNFYEYFNQDTLDTQSLLRLVGTSLFGGAFDAESFLTVKNVDVSCIDKLEHLLGEFNLDSKIAELQQELRSSGYLNKSILKAMVEEIKIDIAEFEYEFKVRTGIISLIVNEMYIDPLGQPTVTASRDNCLLTCRPFVHPSAPTSKSSKTKRSENNVGNLRDCGSGQVDH